MSAVVVATAFGGPEVLSVTDQDVPEPGPGEVRIAVRAAGTNPIDYKVFSGAMGADPGSLPMRLGYEVAGVVTAVGTDATGPAGEVSVGDEVIGYPVSGGYAAELVVPASSVVPKPAAMSWAESAGLMLTGVTATHTLEAVGAHEGDTVLVHGAGGGVGLMVLQLAAARGVTAIGTAGPARQDALREYGAIPVVYGDGLADRVRELAPQGIDAAIDLVGTDEAVDVSLELVADRARIATIAAFGRAGDAGIKALGGGPGGDPGTELRAQARTALTDAVSAGRLRVVVARSYPLDQAADALRELAGGHATGKIVLVP